MAQNEALQERAFGLAILGLGEWRARKVRDS
jgi:hypothetical protein